MSQMRKKTDLIKSQNCKKKLNFWLYKFDNIRENSNKNKLTINVQVFTK